MIMMMKMEIITINHNLLKLIAIKNAVIKQENHKYCNNKNFTCYISNYLVWEFIYELLL